MVLLLQPISPHCGMMPQSKIINLHYDRPPTNCDPHALCDLGHDQSSWIDHSSKSAWMTPPLLEVLLLGSAHLYVLQQSASTSLTVLIRPQTAKKKILVQFSAQ